MTITPQFGSLAYIQNAAIVYSDIKEVYTRKDDGSTILIIVCKPDYNINQIQEFIDENLPLGITYAIQTENI